MEKEILMCYLQYNRNGYYGAGLQCLMRQWQVSGKPFSAAELHWISGQ